MRTKEGTFPLLRLEQHEFLLGQRMRERNSRCAAARADVDNRVILAANQLDAAQRIVEQRASRLVRIRDRRQSGRRDERAQPALKWA
jgi:hypothetical protein